MAPSKLHNDELAPLYQFLAPSLLPEDPTLNAIWKSKCLPKLRVFSWLLVMDRLNKKELMQRKNWQIDGGPFYVLCSSQIEESCDHLFFQCLFVISCWDIINIQWDNSVPVSVHFIQARHDFEGPRFMEIVEYAAWNI
jgi:hypothetical protein